MNSIFSRIFFLILITPGLQNCTIDGFEQGSSPLTNEESIIAGQIIGESVSENHNGLLSSFSEAFAIPTESNLVMGPSSLSTGSFRNIDNYSYEFDLRKGIHHVNFAKQKNNELFNSSSTYTLYYKFFDRDQNIIEFPDLQRNEIEAVEFSATRSGEIQANAKISFFTRTDQIFMDGLSSDSEFITIDGYHSSEGAFTQIRANGSQIVREYLLDINYLDIRINKPVVQTNRNFRKGVNGALSYETTMRQTGNGNPENKIVNGTIELNGDGTALLKFREQFDTFRLQLENGEVFDEDELEGRVIAINLQENVFTISNGQQIQINEQTEIDDGDFNTLEEVAASVDAGVQIIAEGNYFRPDENVNLWIATEVEFEIEFNEFEDRVASVDLARQSFTVINGDRFFLIESSEIEFNNQFESLEDIAHTVETGNPVKAEGDFYVDIETGNRIVKEVEFELDFVEFQEFVTSVNLSESTFTLESGKIVKITEDTTIDDSGDFLNLEEVSEALDEGVEVEAGGTSYLDQASGFWIAVEVEFEG